MRKSLTSYVTESLSKNIKDKLIDILSSDNLTDDIANKMINVYNHESLDTQAIKDHIKEVGLEKNKLALIRLLKEHNFLVQYSDIVTSGNYINDNDIIKGNNIYDILKNKYPSITDEMMREIALLNYADAEGIARGKFEILLDLFLGDITPMNAGKGDVNTVNYKYELKASGARMGSKSYSPVNIDNYINGILNTKAKSNKYRTKDVMSTEAAVINTYNQLSSVGLSDKECCDIMIKSLFAQFGIDVYTSGSKSYVNINGNNINIDLDYIYNEVFSRGKFNVKAMKRIHGCINVLVYHNIETWDYMMVFKGNNRNPMDIVNKGSYFLIDSDEANSIEQLYNDRRFNLSSGGKDDNFAKYCLLTAR